MKRMKIPMLLTALLFIGACLNQAKAQGSKTVTTKSQIINASAYDVWGRLRKIDGLEDIMPDFIDDTWLVDDVKPGIGAKRSCTSPGAPKNEASYTEQIIEYDDEARFYSYLIIEGIPANNMVNSFRVVDLGYMKCMVVWISTMDEFIENPEMTEDQFIGFINSAGDAMMAGLYKLHNGK